MSDRLKYLEEKNQDKNDLEQLRKSLTINISNFKTEEEILAKAVAHAQKTKQMQSDSIAHSEKDLLLKDNSAQLIEQLNKCLSEMMDNRSIMEDRFSKRLSKIECKIAGKYRAKYDNAKHHVHTLKLEKFESSKVNQSLRLQNNKFRSIIAQLQQRLNISKKYNLILHMNHKRAVSNELSMSESDFCGYNKITTAVDVIKNNMRKNRKKFHSDFQFKEWIAEQIRFEQDMEAGINGTNCCDGKVKKRGKRYIGRQQRLHQQRKQCNRSRKQNKNDDDLWNKRISIISTKGNKKIILIEWNFVTVNDEQPHKIMLKHTQGKECGSSAISRRMLLVDGDEKYNKTSNADSFRIEIGNNIILISIDFFDNQYQYLLTINMLSFEEAFRLWDDKNYRQSGNLD